MFFIYLCPVQVINSQNGAPLILVTNEGEAFALAGLKVANKVDVNDFAILKTKKIVKIIIKPNILKLEYF